MGMKARGVPPPLPYFTAHIYEVGGDVVMDVHAAVDIPVCGNAFPQPRFIPFVRPTSTSAFLVGNNGTSTPVPYDLYYVIVTAGTSFGS